jgi:hypothetical protein
LKKPRCALVCTSSTQANGKRPNRTKARLQATVQGAGGFLLRNGIWIASIYVSFGVTSGMRVVHWQVRPRPLSSLSPDTRPAKTSHEVPIEQMLLIL